MRNSWLLTLLGIVFAGMGGTKVSAQFLCGPLIHPNSSCGVYNFVCQSNGLKCAPEIGPLSCGGERNDRSF